MTRTWPRRRLAAGAVALALLAGPVACGTASGSAALPPDVALRRAAAALLDRPGLTVTTRLDSDPSTLAQLGAAGKNPALTAALAGATLVLQVHATHGSLRAAARDRAEEFALSVNAPGAPRLVELRYVAGALFARADVRTLATFARIDQRRLDAFVASAPPALQDAARTAVAGGWLRLPAADLPGAPGGGAPAPPGRGPDLGSVLARDLTVTRINGHEARGDHLALTGSARTLARDLQGALGPALGMLSALPVRPADPSRLPDRPVRVDAYLAHGVLSDLRLDLHQFPGNGAAQHGARAVEVALSRQATVDRPGQSTEVSLAALLAGLGAVGGHHSGPPDGLGAWGQLLTSAA